MKFSIGDYAQALYEAIAAGPADSQLIIQHFLVRLRRDRNRSLLPLILAKLDHIQAEKDNQLLVEVATAEPLTADRRRLLVQHLSQPADKIVQLRETVDPQLIGGVKLKIADRLIDNSIQTKLTQLAAQL